MLIQQRLHYLRILQRLLNPISHQQHRNRTLTTTIRWLYIRRSPRLKTRTLIKTYTTTSLNRRPLRLHLNQHRQPRHLPQHPQHPTTHTTIPHRRLNRKMLHVYELPEIPRRNQPHTLPSTLHHIKRKYRPSVHQHPQLLLLTTLIRHERRVQQRQRRLKIPMTSIYTNNSNLT